MSSKDEFIFKKSALMSTKSGKDILKHIILRETGYKQFHKYSQNNEEQFREFTKRYLLSLHTQIISDPNPSTTMKKFSEEVGSTELDLSDQKIDEVKTRISRPEILADRVDRLLNSNFVVMTFPVLHALFDGASQYQKETIPDEMKNAIIDGHVIAIDLSEPLDRIIDKDEDLDIKLKTRPESISDENMIGCYKKYRSIMGTAGRIMALNRKPLADIYHLGMAKAGESVGCGNEIQGAIRIGQIKIPS